MPSIQRFLLWLLLFGLVGTGAELLLLEHYDGPSQLVPLALIVLAVGVLGWDAARRSRTTVRAVRGVMGALMVAGVLGMVLHLRANVEFQKETDPTLAGAALYWKVLRAKTPPALAPGIMIQFGLLGLVYVYRPDRSTFSPNVP